MARKTTRTPPEPRTRTDARARIVLAIRRIARREKIDETEAVHRVADAGVRAYFHRNQLGCGYVECSLGNRCGTQGRRFGSPRLSIVTPPG